jgi:hypothetical protein
LLLGRAILFFIAVLSVTGVLSKIEFLHYEVMEGGFGQTFWLFDHLKSTNHLAIGEDEGRSDLRHADLLTRWQTGRVKKFHIFKEFGHGGVDSQAVRMVATHVELHLCLLLVSLVADGH